MVRFTVDNRNRLIFYGNPVGYVKADTAVVDEMFRTDELNQYLSRMNLTPRWEDGIFDRLVSGEVTGEELAQSRKGCRIWQLKKDVDVAMRFIGYEDQVRKFGEPDAENYTLVFDGRALELILEGGGICVVQGHVRRRSCGCPEAPKSKDQQHQQSLMIP